jgi:hypothetical protein
LICEQPEETARKTSPGTKEEIRISEKKRREGGILFHKFIIILSSSLSMECLIS